MIFRPAWLEEMVDGPAKIDAENRLFLRLAALYATESGTLVNLAILIGVNPNTLKSQAISKCRASRKTRTQINKIFGREFTFDSADSRDL